MNTASVIYDEAREKYPVSAKQIRQNAFEYWDFIPGNVRSYFVKRICILGTESSGKSILTEKLARYFNTAYVPEMARDIVEQTEDCTFNDLLQVASLHAKNNCGKGRSCKQDFIYKYRN